MQARLFYVAFFFIFAVSAFAEQAFVLSAEDKQSLLRENAKQFPGEVAMAGVPLHSTAEGFFIKGPSGVNLDCHVADPAWKSVWHTLPSKMLFIYSVNSPPQKPLSVVRSLAAGARIGAGVRRAKGRTLR